MKTDYSDQKYGWFRGSDDPPASYKEDWKKSASENVEQWGPIDELSVNE